MERLVAAKDKREAAKYEVLQRARRALKAVVSTSPPTNLESIALRLGVLDIRFQDMHLDGRLLKDGGGYIIEVNKKHPKVRQRFTIAHEISHILVSQGGSLGCSTIATRSNVGSRSDFREEELCNAAASELLIPDEWLQQFLLGKTPSLETITDIARLCATSIEVAARRLVETKKWKCRLLWWRLDGPKPTAVRSYPAYDPSTLATMAIPEEQPSIIRNVQRIGKALAGVQPISIEGEVDEYHIEAWKSGPDSVTSLLILERTKFHTQPNLMLFR